jgi:GDP-L-fucose synthase
VAYKNINFENTDNEEVYCVTTQKNHIIYAGRNNKFNWIGQCDNYDLKNSHVLPGMIRKFHDAKINKSESVELWGTGSPFREFLHVSDMADAALYLMENYNSGEIINVGSGSEITIKELALMIKDIVGYEGQVHFNSDYPDGTPRKFLDTTRLRELGWEPKISLHDGIKSTYEELLKVGKF